MSPYEIIFILYSLASTYLNYYQNGQLGAIESERNELRTIVAGCKANKDEQRRAAYDDASVRAAKEDAIQSSVSEHRERSSKDLQNLSDTCSSTPIGNIGNRMVDDTRRFVEELREHRVPTRP